MLVFFEVVAETLEIWAASFNVDASLSASICNSWDSF